MIHIGTVKCWVKMLENALEFFTGLKKIDFWFLIFHLIALFTLALISDVTYYASVELHIIFLIHVGLHM